MKQTEFVEFVKEIRTILTNFSMTGSYWLKSFNFYKSPQKITILKRSTLQLRNTLSLYVCKQNLPHDSTLSKVSNIFSRIASAIL